jgi:hypothetical protein
MSGANRYLCDRGWIVASLAAKAAKRDDVRELVRLTYAFPGDADEIDSALQQVVTRLDPDRSISDLAHVLTLNTFIR